MKKKILLIISVFNAGLLLAQYGNIKGKIVTTDNRPASDVNVELNSKTATAISEEDGCFTLAHVKEGSYVIVASHIGLKSVEKQVQVIKNQTIEINIVLPETATQLEEVVIRSQRSLNEKAVSIGKVAIAGMDLPQSIAVVGQGIIRDQQAQRLSDIIKNVNGVYLASTRGSTQENFSARGYSFSSSNMFKDGVRVNTGVMPEVSSLEKVEILKGSAAILYGNVAPGGIINMVTRQPKFERGGEAAIRLGSYNLYKPAFDFYGPISNKIAYRINGTAESTNSYRDVVSSKRYYINPSFLFKPGNSTHILLQADFLKHNFTPDFGVGTHDNTKIPNVPRNTFYGTAWQYAKTQQTSATASIKQQLNDKWNVFASFSYQRYNRDYYSTERIQALGNGDWGRTLNKIKTNENYYVGQINLTGKFKTGKIEHTFLSGIDADRYFTQTYSYNQPAIYDTINLFNNSKFRQRIDIPATEEITLLSTPTNRFGAYLQDLFSLTNKLKLLAGLRWSYQQAQPVDTFIFATNTHNTGIKNKIDKAFSPRIGIVYKPWKTTSVSASYANSFSVNSGTDVYGNALSPSIIDQFEAGIKNDFLKGALSANFTVYRIVNKNLAQTALFSADGITPNNNTSLKALTGQTTSDGAELDVKIHPLHELNIFGGYSYNYIRYTETPDAKGNFIEGERLINNPASTANASIFYTITKGVAKGLKLGTSYFYTGTRFAGFNNTKGQTQTYLRNFEVNGFSTIDVTVGYNIKKIDVLAKISNITNTYNYYVHENYSINPIPPRQVIVTVSYRL